MLTDAELLLRLGDFEDSFVERKTANDARDWIPATVAFANSAPIGFPAVLFIGARNDGTIEGTANLDSLQKTYTKKLEDVYPPIPTYSRIVSNQRASCLAVVVQGSADRPHFPCHALTRIGSETKSATDAEVRRMLDERVEKVHLLRQWVGKQITVDKMNLEHIRQMGAVANSFVGVMTECNRFWLTVEHHDVKGSIPLRRVEPSYDHKNNRPKIEVPVI